MSKNVFSLKDTMLSCSCQYFQNFSWKPRWHANIWSKTSILSKLHYIMGEKKKKKIPFFRFSTKKTMLSCLYLIKKRPFSKKRTVLMSIFCQYRALFLENTILSCRFFEMCMKNPIPSRPYLVKKNGTSVITPLYYKTEKSWRLFFELSRKNHCSHAHILSR